MPGQSSIGTQCRWLGCCQRNDREHKEQPLVDTIWNNSFSASSLTIRQRLEPARTQAVRNRATSLRSAHSKNRLKLSRNKPPGNNKSAIRGGSVILFICNTALRIDVGLPNSRVGGPAHSVEWRSGGHCRRNRGQSLPGSWAYPPVCDQEQS